jgi:hypothetical protein
MNKISWTDTEIEILCNCFSNKTNEKLIKLFPDRIYTSIKLKAKRLKLKKNKETEFKNRSIANKGEKNSMWGKVSVKRGKTYDEYYGNDKSSIIKKKLRISNINKINLNKKENHQIMPFYNRKACEYFNNLMKNNNCFIKHAENGGEYYIKELGYFVDIKNNTVYEWDEKQHFRKNNLRDKDIIRQNEITNLLKCKFVRIKESDIL